MLKKKELREELDVRLEEVLRLPEGSEERAQVFEEYKTLYAQYLEAKGQRIEVVKTAVDGAKAVGSWVFYAFMASQFMKFDASGEIPNMMHRSLLTKVK